jgi:hypothetical protein
MTELHDHLAAYLRGEMTLRQFEEWFVPTTWDARDEDDPRVELVRNIIDARIAEFTHGDWDEDELKDFLHPFVETKVIPLAANSGGIPKVCTANESSVRHTPLDLPLLRAPIALPIAPDPQILTRRPNALNEEPEGNLRQQLFVEA